MKKLLASIVSFINRIRQPQWFAIISLIFILPFAVVMYYQIAMINSHISFTRKERMGIEYIQSVIKFLKDVQQDRGMSTAFLSGDVSFKEKLEKKQAELKEDIGVIDSIDEKYGGILKTTDEWSKLKGKCRKLEVMEWGMSPEESFDAHSELAADILSFVFHIRNTSNLILDSYYDSHYLMGISTTRIPPLTESLGKIRAVGARVIARGEAAESDRIKLLILREQIKPAIDMVEDVMKNVFQENPDIEPLLKTYFHDAVFTANMLMDMLNSKIINAKTIDMQTEEYFNAATIAIDANFRLCDAASLTLDRLLQEHIKRHLREKYYIIVSSALIAVVFFYIFYRFKGSLTEQIRAEERLKTTVKEKEMLLKELHHRVKNNLQIISSLSSLQSEYIKDNQKVVEIFKEFQNRIKSMAIVHEKLYKSRDLSRINFSEYIHELTSHIFNSHRAISFNIKLNINADDVFLDVDTAIPLGLIINELVSNSIKYGFPPYSSSPIGGEGQGEGERKGEIVIDLHSDNNKFILNVRDNGVGLPEGLDFKNTKSLGLQLVNTLTEQIRGTIEVDRRKGTEFRISFGK